MVKLQAHPSTLGDGGWFGGLCQSCPREFVGSSSLQAQTLLRGVFPKTCGRDCQPEFRMLVSCLSGHYSHPWKWVKTFTYPPITGQE